MRSAAQSLLHRGAIDRPVLLRLAGGSRLLDGRSATAHWEVLAALCDMRAEVTVTEELFQIDRGRVTCAGGAAGIDLALREIETSFGRRLAERVADHCMHGAPRPADGTQRRLPAGIGSVPDRKLAKAMEILERETPKQAMRRFSTQTATGSARKRPSCGENHIS